jgi:phosphotransferase system HPr-like phosphotransfer protein
MRAGLHVRIAVGIAILLAGCAPDGQVIRQWTLDADARSMVNIWPTSSTARVRRNE